MSLLDIHSLITYSAIAPYLGLEPTAKYSVTSTCPYCGAQAWTINQDNRNLEEWHYCYQCKASGTLIAMAAERLEMSEVEAMQYLAEKLNTRIDYEDLKQFQKSKAHAAKYTKLWDFASKNMLQPSREQIKFLKHLHWRPTQMSTDQLLAGPAKLFGLIHPKHANKILGVTEQRFEGERKRLRVKEVCVVVPFHSSTTNISGVDLVCPSQTLHLQATAYSPYKSAAGFAGLPLLMDSTSDTVVVTSMLTNVMQLQMRHFGSNVNALPLVGWRQPFIPKNMKDKSPAPKRKWTQMGGRNVVLWERAPTAAIIKQALLENARLSFIGPTTSRQNPKEVGGVRWKQWVCHDPAIDIWRRVVRSSRPAEQAVKNWIKRSTPAEQVRLLEDAESYDQETADFVRNLLSSKVERNVARRVKVVPKQDSWCIVSERAGKWYQLDGKEVLPGIVRVTHVIARLGGKQEYAGYFQAGEDKYPFHLPVKEATLNWLKEFIIASGVYIDQINTHKGFCPFRAAIQLEEPEVVRGLTSVGWDGEGFQLRKAKLVDGVFRQNPEFKLPPDAPGPRRDHCKMTEAVKIALQKEGPEMEVVWSTATALCAQITAPAVGLPGFPIYLYRNVTRKELKEHEPRKPGRPWPECDPFVYALYNRFEIRMGDYKQDWPHKWPRRLMQLKRALKCDGSGFFVTRGNLSNPKTTDIVVVNAADKDLEPRKVTHSSDKIVLNYLRHFSTLDVEEGYTWEEWLGQTHRWMYDAFPFVETGAFRKAMARLEVY